MTNILSTISGHFSKSLILATAIPVVLFIILGMIFVSPLVPSIWQFLVPLQSLDTQWKVLGLSIVTVALSGLLYNLNIPLIRLYEGYPWKKSFVGWLLVRRHQKKYRALQVRWHGLRTLIRNIEPGHAAYARLSDELSEIGLRLYQQFPRDPGLILPTRLGNAIRSFEDYPYRQYGMEGISLWPRLAALINKDFAAGIDDAKISFDFTLNCSFLCGLLALIILFAGLISPTMLADPALTAYWVAEITVFAAFAFWFYVMSIDRVGNWGSMFRSAFDLYRWDLLRQLGYRRPPTTMAEERFLWRKIYQQVVYGDTPSVPLAEYARPSVFALPKVKAGVPGGLPLATARGVSLPDADGGVLVTLRVKNVDRFSEVARAVVVSDTLPEGFDYEWNSTRRLDSAFLVEVSGTDPLFFQIGDINYDEGAVIQYRVVPIKSK